MKLLALNAKVKRTAQNLNPTNKTHLVKKTFVDADNHKYHLSMFPLNFQSQRNRAQER
ncbi:hypothetical protein [Vibrio sp. RW]|uniref:hypothetical protein n=1 Tax=Vibrio sp. RW TaxID=2998833 RepID=UPI0022CD4616|nr:hypothetical protein [Vibrio sp. RW]